MNSVFRKVESGCSQPFFLRKLPTELLQVRKKVCYCHIQVAPLTFTQSKKKVRHIFGNLWLSQNNGKGWGSQSAVSAFGVSVNNKDANQLVGSNICYKVQHWSQWGHQIYILDHGGSHVAWLYISSICHKVQHWQQQGLPCWIMGVAMFVNCLDKGYIYANWALVSQRGVFLLCLCQMTTLDNGWRHHDSDKPLLLAVQCVWLENNDHMCHCWVSANKDNNNDHMTKMLTKSAL